MGLGGVSSILRMVRTKRGSLDASTLEADFLTMARLYIFADESGNFDFTRKPRATKYFILCTASMGSCNVANDLFALRRELAWQGLPLGDYFHATTDKQAVRDAVFDVLGANHFRVQATIMEKSKAQPQVRRSKPRFYQYGWFYHFKYGVRSIVRRSPEVLVTAATIGSKKERASFESAVDDVMRQTVPGEWATDFCPSQADPCLQVADYCAWAIQRKWERGEVKSYDLIKDRISYEFDLWERGDVHYY